MKRKQIKVDGLLFPKYMKIEFFWKYTELREYFVLFCNYFNKRNFSGRNFRKVKNSRNFRDKLSRMTSNDAFHENLTFVNDNFT